jgi:SsrA-binding protein
MPTLSNNKKAFFDYEIIESFETGIVLFGHEVKSVRKGRASLKGAFVTLKQAGRLGQKPSLILTNCHIPLYEKASTIKDYDPDRPRGLLLHAHEITKLIGKKKEAGLTLVPLKIYTKRNRLKLEFALARGKKQFDKRETIKKREVDRKIRTLTKRF